jgi:hypothetical protein
MSLEESVMSLEFALELLAILPSVTDCNTDARCQHLALKSPLYRIHFSVLTL